MAAPSETMMLCRHCGKSYKTKGALSVHERKHTGSAPYICCGLFFFSQSHLKRHRGCAHDEGNQFQCTDCDKAFATNGDLLNHRRMVHTEAKIECDICGVKYHIRRDLEVHLSSHRGEKMYKCSCGKGYASRSSLSYHKKVQTCTNE